LSPLRVARSHSSRSSGVEARSRLHSSRVKEM
jgi:hypothetical protein